MTNTTHSVITVKKQAVFSKDKKHRYELTLSLPDQQGKSILVLCLNPASDDMLITDTTTNYLMNNLFSLGYTIITICNLFSTICSKLTTSGTRDDRDGNFSYLQSVLERDFNTILIGYGNAFATNKQVAERKVQKVAKRRHMEKDAVPEKVNVFSRKLGNIQSELELLYGIKYKKHNTGRYQEIYIWRE